MTRGADVGKKQRSKSGGEKAQLRAQVEQLETDVSRMEKELSRLKRREQREAAVMPYQVELLKLQRHLERNDERMIVLFEGRDAAGKGGTIRRVTRYMNEKHYRVVALGKPTEEQRSQWYLQRYVAEFPHGGEMVLFDRSWYNRGDGRARARVLYTDRIRPLPSRRGGLREGSGSTRHHSREALLLGDQEGATAAFRSTP